MGEQEFVNDKLLHSKSVAAHSYQASTNACSVKAAELVSMLVKDTTVAAKIVHCVIHIHRHDISK